MLFLFLSYTDWLIVTDWLSTFTEATRIWTEGESWADSESLWPQFHIFLSPEWTPSSPTCSPKMAQTLITTRSWVFWVYRPVKIQRARSPAAAISASQTAGQAPSTPPPPGCTCPWAPRPECGVMRAILLSALSLEVGRVERAEKVQLCRSNMQRTTVWGTAALF